MRRFLFLITLFNLFVFNIYSQKVDSIKTEQSGDFIKIRYKILNSSPQQIYRVKILCSINGGLNQEIKSISGDVGDQVIGGKSEYWAVWDVLKDVDEVKSVEFVVRADLVKDLAAVQGDNRKKPSGGTLMAALEGDGPSMIFGIRGGYISSWGVMGKFLYGKKYFDKNDASLGKYSAGSISVDLTKSIVLKDKFQMHIYAGPGFSRLEQASPNLQTGLFVTLEGGVLFALSKVTISLGISSVGSNKVDNGNIFPNFAVGLKF
jgi:hypothetical protein